MIVGYRDEKRRLHLIGKQLPEKTLKDMAKSIPGAGPKSLRRILKRIVSINLPVHTAIIASGDSGGLRVFIIDKAFQEDRKEPFQFCVQFSLRAKRPDVRILQAASEYHAGQHTAAISRLKRATERLVAIEGQLALRLR